MESISELPSLRVRIDDVIYMPSLDAPEDRPHPFVYFVTIINESDQAVTIRGRKWVVTQENGEQVVVEGEGVVSQTPTIECGEEFHYNSYHVLSTDGYAEGSFLCQTVDGKPFFTRIPRFEMKIPKWA